MATGGLTTQAHEPALARPALHVVDGAPDVRRAPTGYRLRYAFAGPAGGGALQRVETRVRYLTGDRVLVEYTGAYWEYFRFAVDGTLGRLDDGEPQVDVHAFDVRDDGWTPGPIRRYLARRGLAPALWSDGPTRVECRKTFLLGLGAVDGEEPVARGEDGGEFGFLASGPSPAAARLVLTGPRGERETVEPGSALPLRRSRAAGIGRFVAAVGWRAVETFEHALAGRTGRLDDGGGYAPADLDPGTTRPEEE